jgi:hypothetical protein
MAVSYNTHKRTHKALRAKEADNTSSLMTRVDTTVAKIHNNKSLNTEH